MQFRVVTYFPDRQFGFATSADPFMPRKIVVRDKNVISGRLQIGSLIECELDRTRTTPSSPRYSGKDIRVLR